MRAPRRAIVLAAGFGSRLAPLTLDCPKPLIPVKGTPLIARQLAQLREWGVEEVAVNLHHRADLLVDALPALLPDGMRLTLSYEPVILGTGGALIRLAGFLKSEPFWLCNADVMQEVDPRPLLQSFRRHDPLACLWMVPDHGPRTVKVEQGRVTDFRGGGMTFSGLHLLSPDILTYLPKEEQFCSVIDAYEAAMKKGREVRGVTVPGSCWEDAGTLDRLLGLEGGSLVLPGARVPKTATLNQALVGPGVRIRARRTVQGMVVDPRHFAPYPKPYREAEAVEVLPARGSDRNFLRVHLPDCTYVCVRCGEQRPENFRTTDHFRFLERNGIRVPHMEWSSPGGREIWMEDVGSQDLLQRLQSGRPQRNQADMGKVISLVVNLHQIRIPPRMELEPSFSPELYRWEHQLFAEEFLARHDPETDPAPLLQDLAEVAVRLDDRPQVLIHRDLQSTNLLWHHGEPVLIDVQGMRRGPVVYDLASLFADPYVNRSMDLQLHLLAMYNQAGSTEITVEELALGSMQRLVQALGAYGRLGANPATRRFVDHIPAAVGQLAAWAPPSRLKSWAEHFLMRHAS